LTSGGWGAPLHPYVPYYYSEYGLSTYHFVLVSVFQNGSLHLEAKNVSGQTFDDFWLHSPLKYWDFPNGMYLISQGANITKPPTLTKDNLTISLSAPKGTISNLTLCCAQKGSPLNTTGTASWIYNNDTKMFTATVSHPSESVSVLISWVKLSAPNSGSGNGSGNGTGNGSSNGSGSGSGSGNGSGSGSGSGSGDGSGSGPGSGGGSEQPTGRKLPSMIIMCSLGVLAALCIIVTAGGIIRKNRELAMNENSRALVTRSV
jgi:hypothetical protein